MPKHSNSKSNSLARPRRRRAPRETAIALAPPAPIAPAPASPRELAQRVFAQHDMVAIAGELLTCDNPKGASVKARMWEKLVEFAFGKQPPAPAPQPAAEDETAEVVWDIPEPDPETQPDPRT